MGSRDKAQVGGEAGALGFAGGWCAVVDTRRLAVTGNDRHRSAALGGMPLCQRRLAPVGQYGADDGMAN